MKLYTTIHKVMLSSSCPTLTTVQVEINEADIASFEKAAHKFLYYFTDQGTRLDATLYVHWLVHHAAHTMRKVGALGLYSCETLEKHNSFERRWVHGHCNFHDVAAELFLFEMMSSSLEAFERQKLFRGKHKRPQ